MYIINKKIYGKFFDICLSIPFFTRLFALLHSQIHKTLQLIEEYIIDFVNFDNNI